MNTSSHNNTAICKMWGMSISVLLVFSIANSIIFLHDSPLWALAFLGLIDNKIFTGWGCQPHAQPPIWRTRPPYLWPQETGWSSYTPRHWVPILVAFYDMHELCWDYSYPPVTTRRLRKQHTAKNQATATATVWSKRQTMELILSAFNPFPIPTTYLNSILLSSRVESYVYPFWLSYPIFPKGTLLMKLVSCHFI
jgi:hypothetical protein